MKRVLLPFCVLVAASNAFGVKGKRTVGRRRVDQDISNAAACIDETVTTARKLHKGQILVPSSTNDETQFDTACVACPVVVPPSNDGEKWQLYYYGNAGQWNDGSKGFLPTGWVGLAESEDGIHWEKVVGPLENGAIFAPSDNADDWDSVHIGVGDVVRVSRNELHMYYFGGSSEETQLGPAGVVTGLRMRIGRAKSVDGGRTWERMGTVLNYDPSEGLFASWPRIIPGKNRFQKWRMIYHSFDGRQWKIYGAKSSDKGKTWKRTGLILEGSEDGFDAMGTGTRGVTAWRGGHLMIYEGVNSEGSFSLGAAFDRNGRGKFEKIQDIAGCQEPGGPILKPGAGAMGPWTSLVVGTPYPVSMPDGSLRLYHVAKASQEEGHSIGLVVSDSGDISPGSWRAAN